MSEQALEEVGRLIWESAYAGLEPSEVWRHFAALNAIPRPSGSEAQARGYVQAVAQAAGASWRTDSAGNIVVYVGGTGERAVAVQSHLDMVCEKTPDSPQDFATQGIAPRRVGDRVYGTSTTLGADNGLGAAMALALLTSQGLERPPLELLFTVQEETGLDGALGLDASLLSAPWLLNLDTEEPDEVVIGCAGGRGVNISLPLSRGDRLEGAESFILAIGGLQGGHSGIEIDKPLGNAILLLAQVLAAAQEENIAYGLVEINGGNARNAIPRDAQATIAVAQEDAPRLLSLCEKLQESFLAEWGAHEPGVSLRCWKSHADAAPLTPESSRAVAALLSELPHGVLAWSPRWAGKVETSCNAATLKVQDGALVQHISGRSFRESSLDAWQQEMQELATRHGASVALLDGYPGWEPSSDDKLREVAARAFEEVAGHGPKVEIVHAGLECGIILSKRPGMEAISFGPLIRGAHTPEEWADIPSVAHSWSILLSILRRLASPST
jgi:dipeptidase D